MPYCDFCGKLCPTVPGLYRHIDNAPKCKIASREEFGQYANHIWDDVPNEVKRQPPPIEQDLPDFQLEEDIQLAEEIFNGDETNLPPLPPPQPPQPDEHQLRPQRATVEDVPENEEVIDGRRFIENFPEELLAGATWGNCKPLYEYLEEEQNKEGVSRWGPFKDEDEWELAEWLIQNVGQKQTDTFLKLPIVSFFFSVFVNILME
jgi:hypothetical protein